MALVYLAGPLTGHSGGEMIDSFEERAKKISDCGFNVIHPMMGKEHLRAVSLGTGDIIAARGYNDAISNDQAIYQRDRWCVNKCDIIIADFSHAAEGRVSIGTCFEIAWASLQQKMVVIVGLNETHKHAFITQSGTHFFETLDDALRAIAPFAGA